MAAHYSKRFSRRILYLRRRAFIVIPDVDDVIDEWTPVVETDNCVRHFHRSSFLPDLGSVPLSGDSGKDCEPADSSDDGWRILRLEAMKVAAKPYFSCEITLNCCCNTARGFPNKSEEHRWTR